MDRERGDFLKGQSRVTCGCMVALVEVRERGLGLLRPRLNAGPICDDSFAEGKCANAAQYK